MEEAGQREPIAFHQLSGSCIQQREGAAGEHYRHTPQEVLVQPPRLSHIGQLGGSAHISHSRQHVILNHGPQQRVGRKLLSPVTQFGNRIPTVFGRVVTVLPPQREPPIPIEQKRQ